MNITRTAVPTHSNVDIASHLGLFADENEHYHRQAIASYHGIDDAHFYWERI